MITIKYIGDLNESGGLILYRDFGNSFRDLDKGWITIFDNEERENICKFLDVPRLEKGIIKQFSTLYIKFLKNYKILISKRNDLTLQTKEVKRKCKFLNKWGKYEKPGEIEYYKESSDFILVRGNINASGNFLPELIIDKSELYHPLVNKNFLKNYISLGFYDLSQSYDYPEEEKYRRETVYLRSLSKKELKKLKRIPGHCKECGRKIGTKLYMPFKKYGKDIEYYLCEKHCKKYGIQST